MRSFSSFAILILAAICAVAPTPAAAIAVPNTNAARMTDVPPPTSPILKSRGSSTLDAPQAKRSDNQACVAFTAACEGPYDSRCCQGAVCTLCQNGDDPNSPVYRCLN
ncbi:hypothetical protein FIBSPDRAFT_1045782 [Athelia psychrophila]|uniref:Uncharacterized protein n=1 Tax=Athelia psychrophila TaxID=1759441 RepID=A0A166HMQ1_9AGAM|nr:hypothetical protein FIBSPDRAFT_1045782 [Fibularhizoctonia sp. CBS 109695]